LIAKGLWVSLLCATLPGALDAQAAPKRATLESGAAVWLYADGTWRPDSTINRPKASTGGYTKPSSATQSLTVLKSASFSYDPNTWRQTTSPEPGRLTFTHASGDGYAMVITERLQLSLDALKRVVLTNARNAAPNAKIILEEKRVVNGVEVLCMQITGTTQDIHFRYFGYYYAGKAGTIQVVTYTGENLFEEYEPDFQGLLNGLEAPRS
jgi:hypothetical protein